MRVPIYLTPDELPAGTRVRLTRAAKNFADTIPVGTIATVVRVSSMSHATANGGGWDVTLTRGLPEYRWVPGTNFEQVDQAGTTFVVRTFGLELA